MDFSEPTASSPTPALRFNERTPSMRTIRLISFPGGWNWPIWTAQARGFFTSEGLEITVTPTPSSEFQMSRFYAGEFDIAATAFDNLVAYQEGQGPVQIVRPDAFAFLGVSDGFLRFITLPEVGTFDELRGKDVSVDALNTGYAFVLRKLLATRNIAAGDINFVKVGGLRERWQELLARRQAGTMAMTPFDIMAKAHGLNVLADGTAALGAYQGTVLAARRSWAKDHEQDIVKFAGAYRRAVDWLYNPMNRNDAVDLFLAHAPDMDRARADASYGVLLGPKGFFRDAKVSIEGAQAVLDLRSEYAEPTRKLSQPEQYIDHAYWKAASALA